jgi:fructokinase
MVIVVGEILFDHFPNYRVLGGAPFNFSYHLKRLGIPVRFISRVGDDSDGQEIINRLEQFEFNTNDIQIDDTRPTGRVTVRTDTKGVPVFHIHTNVAYDYLELDNVNVSNSADTVNLVYYGSLIQRSKHGSNALQGFLSTISAGIKCLCDINLRPDCYNKQIVIESLSHADILKLNDDELNIIGQMTGKRSNRSGLIDHLMNEYGLEVISLTKGSSGSELFVKGECFAVKTEKIHKIADTVGAGDAYAAVLAIGYLRKWHPDRILSTANRFSGRLCSVRGAIPPTRFYREFRDIKKGRE